ncbi:MAG TPA: hypothetical protein VKA77_08570 [Mycobacterium sp.]|nr:hypothetical protein [Mycobacterium sp.]
MANGAKVALAVGAGYLLGRTKRTRLALMLAAAGITGKFPSSPTDLVAHGVKSLGTSDQLTDLTAQLRGELLNAAKAAAVAAATSRVDALNDRLQGVVSPSNVSDLADQAGVSDVADRAGAPLRSLGRRRPAQEQDEEDVYDTEEEEEEGVYDDEDEPSEREGDADYEDNEIVDEDEELEPEAEPEELQARPRRRASRQETSPRSSARRSARKASDAAPTRRRRASASTKRAPVRRGR